MRGFMEMGVGRRGGVVSLELGLGGWVVVGYWWWWWEGWREGKEGGKEGEKGFEDIELGGGK